MRRFACSLIALSLLGVPRLARAHDPLDDVSGEDDPNAKNDDQPRSHRKERQEAEIHGSQFAGPKLPAQSAGESRA